jgi:predicted PurR-regulated permease PerM
MKQEGNHILKLLIYSALILAIIAVIYLLTKLSSYLIIIWVVIKAVGTPFIIAIILAYLLNPIVTMLNNRKVPRGMAVAIIYFTFLLLLTIFLINAIPAFIKQSQDLTEHLPQLIQTYQIWISELHTHKYDFPAGIRKGIDEFLVQAEEKSSVYFANLLEGATGLFQKLIHFLVIPFLVFYLLKDMKLIQRGLVLLVPHRHRKTFTRMFHEIDEALGNYIRGQLVVCGVVGTLAYIGYWLIDMPYALVLALIIGITNIIPYLGPIIGAAPSILVAITISWQMTLLVLVVNLAIQIIEGNIVSPMVMGRTLHIHPLMIIFALLIGGEIGGLLGLIFAVPILAVIRVVLHNAVLHLVKH